MFCDPGLGFFQLFAWQVMGREACPKTFCPIQPCAGECQELSQTPAQPREIPAAANVGEQADARFRHGEARVLRRNTEFAGL